ncbi:MAG TPA: glycosyltransferase family 1 protein [Tepidisphaeraceae bacterium]|nr:glycosyltransferase family 1 protein [Tepidisphaeraceae bacterium]
MRILYDHAIFARQLYGGFSRYFTEIIPRIARSPQAKVNLFMGLHISRYNLADHKADFEHFFGFHRPISRGTFRMTLGLNNWLFERFARKYPADIFHQTAYLDLPAPGAKRIVTLHDLTPEKFPHLVGAPDVLLANRREVVMKADGVICISEQTRKDMLEIFGTPSGKVAVIHHANSLHRAAATTCEVDGKYILFVGARGGYKGFDTLLRAYAQSQQLNRAFKLVAVGSTPLSREEMNLASKLGISDRLFHLTANDDKLATLYSHAAAFIYPSLYEGFGIPLLEAMYYGCPVVASNASCFPEIAGAAAMYFEPGNAEDLADKIQRVLQDEEKRTAMIDAGKMREAQFSWDRCARETLEFYGSVLG